MKTNDIIFNAFANGDLINVLRGAGDYSVGLDQWVSAAAPTDWTKVLPLFYKYANEIGLNQAKEMLEKAILTLLNGNAEDLYIGMSVLYLQILREEGNRSPLAINREKLLQTAANRIKESKNELHETKMWQGQNNPDGLLAEVERYRELLKSKFGIEMHPQVEEAIEVTVSFEGNPKRRITVSANTIPDFRKLWAVSEQLVQPQKYNYSKFKLAADGSSKNTTMFLRKAAKYKKGSKKANDVLKKIN